MNQKILSMQELEEIESNIASFNSGVVEFEIRFNGLLKMFNDEAVVQSFYDSGFLGKKEMERLIALKKGVNSYVNILSEGPNALIPALSRYVREQKDLVSMQTRGYSISESIAARREGNRG